MSGGPKGGWYVPAVVWSLALAIIALNIQAELPTRRS